MIRLAPLLAALTLTVAGCVDDDAASDGQATIAAWQAPQAGDDVLHGTYAAAVGPHALGDLTALELQSLAAVSPPGYVRLRCYHDGCTHQVAETDRYDLFTSSSGRRYLRFWARTVDFDGVGDVTTTPVVADVYEVQVIATGLRLRRGGTSRWIDLAATPPATTCAASGGAWTDPTCACPTGQRFVAGAGGCVVAAADSEAACDAASGLWTDDDATLLGTYCVCGAGRYEDPSGGCAAP